MAGLVAAVAPGATIVPIRVVGWQQGKDGSFALTGRGDQLIAGLERAVDPNGDGAVTDGATRRARAARRAVRRLHRQPRVARRRGLRPSSARSSSRRPATTAALESASAASAHRAERRMRSLSAPPTRAPGSRWRHAWVRAGGDTISAQPVRILGKTTLSARVDPGRRRPPRPVALEPDASGGGRVRRLDARRFLRHERREPGRRPSRARPC